MKLKGCTRRDRHLWARPRARPPAIPSRPLRPVVPAPVPGRRPRRPVNATGARRRNYLPIKPTAHGLEVALKVSPCTLRKCAL